MARPASVTINLSALRHNLQRVRNCAPHAKILCAVKANGYGHGAVMVAKTLVDAGADALAVACLEEAISLRDAGITQPIVLLEGVFSADELTLAAQHQLQLIVHQAEQVTWLENWSGHAFKVWLKIDTGMHRLGIAPEEFEGLHARLLACQAVVGEPILMTHFACADERGSAFTQQQINTFSATTKNHHSESSLANSAGILAWPQSHANWVRPGIMLYGASPFAGEVAADQNLQAVMTLRSEIIAINTIAAGESVGYGATWQAKQATRVGVIAIGYGDGYPRHAPSGTPVLVNGQVVPLIGRVSMDMITVDLHSQPNAKIGDAVVLWGEGLPVEKVAAAANTISYALFCGVTARVRKHIVY